MGQAHGVNVFPTARPRRPDAAAQRTLLLQARNEPKPIRTPRPLMRVNQEDSERVSISAGARHTWATSFPEAVRPRARHVAAARMRKARTRDPVARKITFSCAAVEGARGAPIVRSPARPREVPRPWPVGGGIAVSQLGGDGQMATNNETMLSLCRQVLGPSC